MPAGLKRYSGHDYLHFLTCSTYHRQPWLANPRVLNRKRRNPSQSPLWPEALQHVWQKRFYDFHVWSERKRVEKLR
jgi:hypothetical protein